MQKAREATHRLWRLQLEKLSERGGVRAQPENENAHHRSRRTYILWLECYSTIRIAGFPGDLRSACLSACSLVDGGAKDQNVTFPPLWSVVAYAILHLQICALTLWALYRQNSQWSLGAKRLRPAQLDINTMLFSFQQYNIHGILGRISDAVLESMLLTSRSRYTGGEQVFPSFLPPPRNRTDCISLSTGKVYTLNLNLYFFPILPKKSKENILAQVCFQRTLYC